MAVLPFTYLGAEDSTDYFSLGVTEEVLTRLAQVSDLAVISRTSVMRYQHTEKSLQEIARELGVAAVVEGSVQHVGDQVRVTAQLIDAETDRHLWGQSYNREIEDILAVQSEVAMRIAEALQARLLPQERIQLTTQRDVDETAYHLYLRAQHLRDLRSPEGVVRATTLLREAVDHDTSFAPAYGGLAMAAVWSGLMGQLNPSVVRVTAMPVDSAAALALRTADRALALDSTVVEAHLARALVYQIFTREWDRSRQAFRQALRINPNHSEAIQEYGWMHLRLGRVDSALAHMQRAVRLDPFSWSAHLGLGYAYHCRRRYEDAIRELETALDMGGQYPMTRKFLPVAHILRARALYQQGRGADVEAHVRRADEVMDLLWGPDPGRRPIIDYAVRGQPAEALRLLDPEEAPDAFKFWILTLTDQRDAMLDHIGHRFTWSVFANPYYDPVRDDPRFEQLVERRLEHEVDI